MSRVAYDRLHFSLPTRLASISSTPSRRRSISRSTGSTAATALVAWLAQADLVPAHALNALVEQATPGELDKVADQARALREWFRGFVRKHMGRPLTPKAMRELGPLNALLERDEMFSRIAVRPDSDGDRLELQTMRLWRSPESLLLPIGEALARCVCDEDFANIRACEGHRCTLIFADRTRQAREKMVQHGGMRQSRQTSRSSPSAQGRALTRPLFSYSPPPTENQPAPLLRDVRRQSIAENQKFG